MFSKEDRNTMIEAIRRLPEELSTAVNGMSDQELDTPYRPGGWTARQVVHHLADSHMNAFVRMKLILTEDHPTLKAYDQDAWASTTDCKGTPIASSISILRGLHERWATLLRLAPEEAWGRTAFHPEDGEVTLEGLLKTYATHGERHIQQIKSTRGGR
jgi:hypothetical protein